MQLPGPMYDLEIEFFEYFAPAGLLSDWLWRASKPLKCGMICPYYKLSS